ncbi:hypothetical protein EV702DRAFT_1049552 [Suillus placidus]|uniref:Uncharacterized protein n=1 Tax=Suillus placidus TaxID=48579 RepID=A0A9P6ZK91_9AGAM|nr:hypothetical protein EV702DRAFT_1049552 [Suillus placidus]
MVLYTIHKMMELPNKTKLLLAIEATENGNTLTHQQMQPRWIINLRRVKRLRGEAKESRAREPCITMDISGDITLSANVTQGLLLLLADLVLIRRQRPNSNNEALQVIEELLPAGTPQQPLVLFPRDQLITRWYYHIYHTARSHDNRAYHPIMLEIFGKKQSPRGDLVVVKNGEDFAPQSPDFDVDVEELGKMLWWYIRTGRDPMKEASERRMLHYIEQL